MLCECNHTVCNLLGLSFFIQHNSLWWLHVLMECPFSLLINISWYRWIIVLFNHSLLKDRHLGCFWFETITNEAAVNIHVQCLSEHFSFLWDKCSGLQLLDCVVAVDHQSMNYPISQHPHHNFVLSLCFILAIVIGV